MSSRPVRRPSARPVPRSVFWRRRFLLLAGLIAVAWIATTLWPGGSDEDPPAAQPSASAASGTSTPTPEPAPTQAAQTGVDVTLTGSSAACDPEQVRITPTVPAKQRAKKAVRVELLVSTTAAKACTLDPAAADLLAVVSSGDAAVWDSSVCKSAILDEPVALSPGWTTSVASTWSGRGSGPACSAKEGWASPGTYTLRIGTLGGEPGRTKFRLEQAAAKPKSSASPSPSTTSTAKPKASATPSPETTVPTPAGDED